MVVPCHYKAVTEIPEGKASQEQLERLYARYKFAGEFCNQRNILEVACGSGIGLGYLANNANKVVGGDIDEELLAIPKRTYHERRNIKIARFDAENLPFKEKRFDIVLLYEAIYYIKHPERFTREVVRVLGPGGKLIVCTVNKDWADFNPSPMSEKYFSVSELHSLLSQVFPRVELFGAFPVSQKGSKDVLLSLIKRIAVSFHLIPKTMKGKEFFKRFFFGKLTPLPFELDEGAAGYCMPVPMAHDMRNNTFKILFAVASM